MTYAWYQTYKNAILETHWTKIQERLEWAESEIHARLQVLSMDHGGTPEERQAIDDALAGIKSLKAETASWQSGDVSGGDSTGPTLDQ